MQTIRVRQRPQTNLRAGDLAVKHPIAKNLPIELSPAGTLKLKTPK
jgi:hypothetical protein